jgi:hypothetical protein
MIAFINEHRNRITADELKWGVEPICAASPIAPATYCRQDLAALTP